MKAVVRYGTPKLFGGYKYEDVPIPTVGDDDLLIEVKAAAICGADLKHFGIDNGSDNRLSVWGHEFSGVIVETGKNVVDWKVNDRVVSDNTGYVCGKCHACSAGNPLVCPDKKSLGLGIDGGFTKFVKIPGQVLSVYKNCLFKVPDNVSFEEACVLDPISNAYMAVAQRSNLLPGEDVVIFGAGPLGLFSLQIAKLMGAERIILVGLKVDTEFRFEVAKKLGATHLIVGDEENVIERVEEICGRNGIGLIIDCAGAPVVLEQSLQIVRTNAQIVRVGMGYTPIGFSINDLSMKAITLTGHMAYNTVSWKNSIRLLESGKLDVKSMITHRMPLSKWEDGFKAMLSREAIKVILTYDGD